jgi:hypothetical protein
MACCPVVLIQVNAVAIPRARMWTARNGMRINLPAGAIMNFTTGEIAFLLLVLGLFASFGTVLAYVAWKDPDKP